MFCNDLNCGILDYCGLFDWASLIGMFHPWLHTHTVLSYVRYLFVSMPKWFFCPFIFACTWSTKTMRGVCIMCEVHYLWVCVHSVSYWYNCESVVSICTSVISLSTTIFCAMLELSDRVAFCDPFLWVGEWVVSMCYEYVCGLWMHWLHVIEC